MDVSPLRTRWTAAALAFALTVATLTSVLLLRIPVQLSDSFTEFMVMQKGSLWQVVQDEFQGGPYLRPFRRGLIKVVHDLSGGQYQAAFRGFQAAQLILLLVLVVGALKVRTRTDAAVVPITLAVLLGGHTFAGAILEGLPINHFLTILVCCAAAMNLVRATPSLLVDASAIALMVFAMLTIESGLVLVVVFVSAYLVGYRGVSRMATASVVLCVLAYMTWRFAWLDGTTPGLDERSAGFGFRVLSTGELMARFGANPWPFRFYNVLSAVSSVLFSEPRGGVWEFVRGIVQGRPEPWRLITVVSSSAVTLLLAVSVWRRIGAWRRGVFATDTDRLLVMFLVVLAANALFAYAYEKDAILGPAGLFYALAASAVFRDLANDAGHWPLQRSVMTVVVVLVACGWTIRFLGIHYSLQMRELTVRNEWAYYEDWVEKQQFQTPFTARETAIQQALRRQAIRGASGIRQFASPWPRRLFDITQ